MAHVSTIIPFVLENSYPQTNDIDKYHWSCSEYINRHFITAAAHKIAQRKKSRKCVNGNVADAVMRTSLVDLLWVIETGLDHYHFKFRVFTNKYYGVSTDFKV
jgi:hypothetical protein